MFLSDSNGNFTHLELMSRRWSLNNCENGNDWHSKILKSEQRH